MRVIDTRFSLLSFWQHLVFTEAALLANPETRPLAAPFSALLDDFQALHGSDLATRRATLCAQARAVMADVNVDDGIRRLHSDTLNAVTQNREDPIFKGLFKSDLAATIRFALTRQLTVAGELVDALALSIVPTSLKAHAAKLQELIAAGQAVLEERKTARFQRAEAGLAFDNWKGDVNALRLSTYGALLGLAAKQKRAKVWAEGFFMQSAEPDVNDSVDTDTDGVPPTTTVPVDTSGNPS